MTDKGVNAGGKKRQARPPTRDADSPASTPSPAGQNLQTGATLSFAHWALRIRPKDLNPARLAALLSRLPCTCALTQCSLTFFLAAFFVFFFSCCCCSSSSASSSAISASLLFSAGQAGASTW